MSASSGHRRKYGYSDEEQGEFKVTKNGHSLHSSRDEDDFSDKHTKRRRESREKRYKSNSRNSSKQEDQKARKLNKKKSINGLKRRRSYSPLEHNATKYQRREGSREIDSYKSRSKRKEKEERKRDLSWEKDEKRKRDAVELEDRYKGDSNRQFNSTKYEKSLPYNLENEIRNILRTEKHHVIRKERANDGYIVDVEWCYYYLDPGIRGHLPGGRARLHHMCRVCKRTCLHLLGKYGTGNRKCLSCAAEEMGWKKEQVPSWYYHKTCKHCYKSFTRR